MNADYQTAVVVYLEHDEVHLLRNALRATLRAATQPVPDVPTLSEDDVDQYGKIRDLIKLLSAGTIHDERKP